MLYCVYSRSGFLADGFNTLDEAQQWIDDSGLTDDDVYVTEYDEEEDDDFDDDDDEYYYEYDYDEEEEA